MRLELRGLTKRFGSLLANDHIDLVVEPGEIHCLLGENGAGKSTLMNMLYGLLQPDEGEILLDGKAVTCLSPSDAIDAGIGMVHQHFMLVPVFTVAENIILGREPTKGFAVLDRAAARRQVRELSERYGFPVRPDALVADLSVGEQQRVEILKALANNVEVLILDEPTAVLTPQEIDELIEVLRAIAANGTSIIFITHKLKEVTRIADRITVIRRGKVVGTVEPDTAETDLAELMVGRSVELVVAKTPAAPTGPTLVVDGLTVVDAAGAVVVDDVSFRVDGGEIVGIAGVVGNGQSELVSALLGLRTPVAGTVAVGGWQVVGRSPRQHLAAGIGYVPEDRSHDGIIGTFSVAENLVLDLIDRPEFSRHGVLSPAAVKRNATQRIAEFDIRTGSIADPVRTLSGGNQQKVVLARELSRPLEVLIAGQPTRGLDVGSIEFVHKRIVRERDQGTAVLIVSTELDEIYALSDRIIVMYRGRIVGVVGPDTPRDRLGLMMAGAAPEEDA
ncbi:putative ABC transporter ATP-binding protein [Nocardia brasiliensis NBRC 14402]|uniref:ABC transporter ATP-binding protein n=1 Tax=Nocardia brasiliensis TaxID=37326 RepID=UPI0002DA8E2C|nr:ABC transporter ATP-binding protein [Nocardia brasiliensis]AVL26548.1 ABC transporter ATP-binding protein [Nocardia brasiliensis]GAJ85131.1 putative ABC transporter ATP-binding protein [Nocardia brasiliensis NBRC 14402]SUB53287.1 Ribose import ATP-binding protein RbsA [Nocardia brasiliensis]